MKSSAYNELPTGLTELAVTAAVELATATSKVLYKKAQEYYESRKENAPVITEDNSNSSLVLRTIEITKPSAAKVLDFINEVGPKQPLFAAYIAQEFCDKRLEEITLADIVAKANENLNESNINASGYSPPEYIGPKQ